MLDCNEMAKAALRRVGEIKANRKRKRRLWEASGVLFSVCAVVSVLVIVIIDPPTDHISLYDEQAPLAAPLLPDDNAKLYKKTKQISPNDRGHAWRSEGNITLKG